MCDEPVTASLPGRGTSGAAAAWKLQVRMSPTLLFALITAYCVVWVLDPAGIVSGLLRAFHRALRRGMGPWDEESYVAVNRWAGVVGIILGLAGTVASLR